MNWLENLKLAAETLWANRLRSLLTMLGLIIGISSVILVTKTSRKSEDVRSKSRKKVQAPEFIYGKERKIYAQDGLQQGIRSPHFKPIDKSMGSYFRPPTSDFRLGLTCVSTVLTRDTSSA